MHDDDAGFAGAAHGDAEQGAEAEFCELLRAEHFDFQAEVFQLFAAIGHFGGGEHVRRLADEVAGEGDAFDGGVQRRPELAGGGRAFDQQGDAGELRLVFRLFGGAVAVEAIGAQLGAQCDRCGQRRFQAGGGDGGTRLARQQRHQVAAGFLGGALGQRFQLADADGYDAGQAGAGREDDAGRAGLAFEFGRREGA